MQPISWAGLMEINLLHRLGELAQLVLTGVAGVGTRLLFPQALDFVGQRGNAFVLFHLRGEQNLQRAVEAFVAFFRDVEFGLGGGGGVLSPQGGCD